MKDRCFELWNTLERLVKLEHENQITKWGIQDHDLFKWLTFTTEELGELAKEISEQQFRNGTKEKIVKEAIQTATLCLKIAEMNIDTL